MERSADAFVIWIDGAPGAERTDGALAGRIEHVQSAVRGTFASAQELLAFLAAHRRSDSTPSESGGV